MLASIQFYTIWAAFHYNWVAPHCGLGCYNKAAPEFENYDIICVIHKQCNFLGHGRKPAVRKVCRQQGKTLKQLGLQLRSNQQVDSISFLMTFVDIRLHRISFGDIRVIGAECTVCCTFQIFIWKIFLTPSFSFHFKTMHYVLSVQSLKTPISSIDIGHCYKTKSGKAQMVWKLYTVYTETHMWNTREF